MLPSPIIEGTLPAFYSNGGGTVITVPFSMSRAVNRDEVKGFSLKIKNLQGSAYLGTVSSTAVDYAKMTVKFDLTTIDVNDKFKLKIGSFYKAQLAYVDSKGEVGNYSTVGIIKYTTRPNVSILNLSTSRVNSHTYTYTGVYSQKGLDVTEKIYSYRFVIKNDKNEIIKDTDYIVHNSANDIDYFQSSDTFTYTYDLKLNSKYTITYSVKTNNGLEITSPAYKIMEKAAQDVEGIANIVPVLNYDNGYIEIFFNKNMSDEKVINGTFILSRASEDFQYQNWETIVQFNLFSQKASDCSWRDFSIEQGKRYQYSIQRYSKMNQLYSKRLVSDTIFADFEDSFLYDGKRQLKIKFNPKMSSFKKNLFEAKVDTLGSKHPFIFRNGNVEYREFPISGLISYLSDEQSLFGNNAQVFKEIPQRKGSDVFVPYQWIEDKNSYIQDTLRRQQYRKDYCFFYIYDYITETYVEWEEYLRENNKNLYFREPIFDNEGNMIDEGVKYINTKHFDPSDYDTYFNPSLVYYLKVNKEDRIDIDNLKLKTTNLVSHNISLERDFKMDVLDWLTDGEPKLFRSPTEGNFIIRLLNVSLSPEDRLGRMLHTFNATAYEIADFNYSNLKEFNFINTDGFKQKYLKIHSIPLITDDENLVETGIIQYEQKGSLWYAKGGESLMPALALSTEFLEIFDTPAYTIFKINDEEVIIGESGHYETDIPVTKLSLLNNWHENVIPNEELPHITMGYLTDIDDSFSIFSNLEIKDVCGRQFIGYHEDIKPLLENFETTYVQYQSIKLRKRDATIVDKNQIDVVCEIDLGLYKDEINKDIVKAQGIDGLYYQVGFKKPDNIIDLTNDIFKEYHINYYENPDYELFVTNNGTHPLYYWDKNNKEFKVADNSYTGGGPYYLKENIYYLYDPKTKKIYLDDRRWNHFKKLYENLNLGVFDVDKEYLMDYSYSFNNSERISLKKTMVNILTELVNGPLESLFLADGVVCDITYRTQIQTYTIKSKSVREAKEEIDNLLYLISQEGMLEKTKGLMGASLMGYIRQLIDLDANFKTKYDNYLIKLKEYINSLKKYQ